MYARHFTAACLSIRSVCSSHRTQGSGERTMSMGSTGSTRSFSQAQNSVSPLPLRTSAPHVLDCTAPGACQEGRDRPTSTNQTSGTKVKNLKETSIPEKTSPQKRERSKGESLLSGRPGHLGQVLGEALYLLQCEKLAPPTGIVHALGPVFLDSSAISIPLCRKLLS